MILSKQYNDFADTFAHLAYSGQDPETSNLVSLQKFYSLLSFIHPGQKLLDVGCGTGTDMEHYKKLGATVYGTDPSEEMVKIASEALPDSAIKVLDSNTIPFEDGFFDIVLSKYALQTADDLQPIFNEIDRVLKSGGILMYLVTHPFRQYFERRDNSNYFEQKIVDSHVFKEQITFKEPTHTFNEYLNSDFLSKFEIQHFEECWDPSAEQIEGAKYPGFFILLARKKF